MSVELCFSLNFWWSFELLIFLHYLAFRDLITSWSIGRFVDVVFGGKKNNLIDFKFSRWECARQLSITSAIPPFSDANFQINVISWCGNFVERHSFCIVSGESPETMRKLCLSTKFSHQEIRWNYDILRSVILAPILQTRPNPSSLFLDFCISKGKTWRF